MVFDLLDNRLLSGAALGIEQRRVQLVHWDVHSRDEGGNSWLVLCELGPGQGNHPLILSELRPLRFGDIARLRTLAAAGAVAGNVIESGAVLGILKGLSEPFKAPPLGRGRQRASKLGAQGVEIGPHELRWIVALDRVVHIASRVEKCEPRHGRV